MADESVKGGTDGVPIAVDLVDGKNYQRFKLDKGADGASVPVTDASPLPVSGPLTDAELRATPVPVSGTVTVANPTADPETGLATEATLQALLTAFQAFSVDGGAP
jgi:hypothetical protein